MKNDVDTVTTAYYGDHSEARQHRREDRGEAGGSLQAAMNVAESSAQHRQCSQDEGVAFVFPQVRRATGVRRSHS